MLLEYLEEEIKGWGLVFAREIKSSRKYLNQFYCYEQGMKSNKGKGEKAYTKIDFRTSYKAMIEFQLNDKGIVEMMVTESKFLKHANEVYTIEAYRLFEEQFMQFPEYHQELVVCNEGKHVYEAWLPDRWTKDIDLSLGSSSVGDVGKVSKNDITGYSA
ncbi:hypothetical protein M9H77_21219 [Catharanthus roseus]|uniref:Uncharacterized protein n=1 Tax=Catharanthus roseus TaxID=4058 RepID=A0ACC0AMR6_CATRO|nr:hypothetical protein M9H77_21219 [Catharanthus roseus]